MRSSAALVVTTLLLLLAFGQGNRDRFTHVRIVLHALSFFNLLLTRYSAFVSASSSPQLQHHLRKMLDVGGAPSPSAIVSAHGCADPEELMRVSESSAGSEYSGVPEYTVEITNTCLDCIVCAVHLSCGDFANTELVDPATFRRLAVDDCLVNDGGPIGPGELITFQYANSFIYDMKIKSASCKCA
jgi:hypothetical protein